MREACGDLFDWFGKAWIVIPTNWGYKTPDKKTGRPGPNVMGKGVAARAAVLVPHLPQLYGEYCAKVELQVTFDLSTAMVLFPTKVDYEKPAFSWKKKSTVELVEKCARELAAMTYMNRKLLEREGGAKLESDDVYLPTVGCGSGGLTEKQVVPMLHEVLSDRFVLVRPF